MNFDYIVREEDRDVKVSEHLFRTWGTWVLFLAYLVQKRYPAS